MKIEKGSVEILPDFCHCRESGNPVQGKLPQKIWTPAFAGVTKRKDFDRAIEKYLTALVIAALIPGVAMAQTQSGFSFLKIGVGARAIGLGSAYTALSNDVTSIYWNPAGLTALKKREFSAMHGQWLAESNFDFLGYGSPLGSGVLALSVAGLSHPSLEERDDTGRLIGGFNARDLALGFAYAQRWSLKLHGGAGIKYIQSQIGADKAEGFALDLGASYHALFTPISIGLTLQNLGPGIRFINERTRLPLTAALGVAWHLLPGLALAADLKQLVYDKKTNVSFGTEYMALPIFTLRGGYLFTPHPAPLGSHREPVHSGPRKGRGGEESRGQSSGSGFAPINQNSLSLGFGLRVLGSRLDYAFTPFGELGNTHRISLGGRF